jgi:hypothetical protein
VVVRPADAPLAEAADRGTVLRCGECGASIVLGAYRTAVCPYCACPTVVERPAAPDLPNPVFALPFTVSKERAMADVARWQRRMRLFHRSFSKATIEEIKGVYLPAYLYSAVIESRYQARIGENYTETETYTTTDSQGKTVTRTRTVTKTEWRDLAGEHAAYATDLVVTASRGLPNAELEHIEPFDLRALRRYHPALVSGWLVEEPSLRQGECTDMARLEAQRQEGERLSAFMPGDKFDDLRFSMTVQGESIDPILVPVWVLAVRPDPKQPAVRVVANGQTAEVWGPEKLSAIKILLFIAAILAFIALAALVATGGRLR